MLRFMNKDRPLVCGTICHACAGFEVTPQIREPFKAETQTAIVYTSREKYSAGKMVFIRYDPANKAQVALDRAA